MTDFYDLKPSLQLMIESETKEDPYGLSPKSLYDNICGTLKTVSPQKTAEIFGISESLCEMIQKENKGTV